MAVGEEKIETWVDDRLSIAKQRWNLGESPTKE